MSVLFFDTETTGMALHAMPFTDPDQPDIVQLAALLHNDVGEEVASLNVLVTPKKPIDLGAAAVHGITQEMVETLGVSIANAAYLFRDLAAAADTIVAHNLKFDRKIMSAAIFRQEIPEIPWDDFKLHCTMMAATNVCKLPGKRGYKWPRLQEAYFHFFQKKFDGAHNALADVRACALVHGELMGLGAFG